MFNVSLNVEGQIRDILSKEKVSGGQKILIVGLDKKGEMLKQFPSGDVTSVEMREERVQALRGMKFVNKPKIICGKYPDVINRGEQFSIVVIKHLVHLVKKEDAQKILKGGYENLQPGGVMCVTVPGLGNDTKTENLINSLKFDYTTQKLTGLGMGKAFLIRES